jgi:hypothetical protein
MSDICVG